MAQPVKKHGAEFLAVGALRAMKVHLCWVARCLLLLGSPPTRGNQQGKYKLEGTAETQVCAEVNEIAPVITICAENR